MRNAREPKNKLRDRIRALCLRTRNKTEGSNPIAMSENSKQNEGIEFGSDGEYPEKKRNVSNLGAMLKNPEQKEGIESGHDARELK